VVTPAARRAAVSVARDAHGITERRACLILGSDRSVIRYRPRQANDAALRDRLKELAAERRRFGYWRLKVLLDREGMRMNHKKLRRLYSGKRPACDVLHRRVELSRLRTMVGSPVRVCAAAEERADDAGRNCMLLRLRRIQ
jgi:transposase InsO family protein